YFRELPHDVRLLGVAEVQAIGRAHRSGAGAGYISCSPSHGVHRTQLRVEITPATVAIERHGEATLRCGGIRILDADQSSVARARPFARVGLHHRIVLLPHPALAANVWAGQQTFEIAREIA